MVEIKHKHILEVAMALTFPGYILIIFCGECILVVFYLINRLPTEVLKDKLLFNGQKANIGNLRTIVCLWYATRMVKPNKFTPRADTCVIMGYSATQKGYRMYSMSQ